MLPMHVLVLSPWDKWRHYGKIPVKVFLTLALMFSMAMICEVNINDVNPYVRASARTWRAMLTPPMQGDSAFTSMRTNNLEAHLNTVEQFVASITHVLHVYYHLDEYALDKYK